VLRTRWWRIFIFIICTSLIQTQKLPSIRTSWHHFSCLRKRFTGTLLRQWRQPHTCHGESEFYSGHPLALQRRTQDRTATRVEIRAACASASTFFVFWCETFGRCLIRRSPWNFVVSGTQDGADFFAKADEAFVEIKAVPRRLRSVRRWVIPSRGLDRK